LIKNLHTQHLTIALWQWHLTSIKASGVSAMNRKLKSVETLSQPETDDILQLTGEVDDQSDNFIANEED